MLPCKQRANCFPYSPKAPMFKCLTDVLVLTLTHVFTCSAHHLEPHMCSFGADGIPHFLTKRTNMHHLRGFPEIPQFLICAVNIWPGRKRLLRHRVIYRQSLTMLSGLLPPFSFIHRQERVRAQWYLILNAIFPLQMYAWLKGNKGVLSNTRHIVQLKHKF